MNDDEERIAHTRLARDGAGVLRACNERGVHFTYEAEWREAFKRGDVGAGNLRTVSKGSSRGAGPQKKQGRVYGRGGLADDVTMCKHGLRAVCCSNCRQWHCACPGQQAHACAEAA